MIAARTQFLAAAVATLAGIVVLAGFGFHALDRIAASGATVKADLTRLGTTAEVEDALRDLGQEPVGADATKQTKRLAVLMNRLRRIGPAPEDAELFAEVERRVTAAQADPSPDAWFSAGETVGRLEQAIIRRTQLADAEEDAESRSHWVLRIGGAVVALFGVTSAIVFLRWEREKREAQERLRRSDRLAALGTIAASVAHEINNPLATISGCATAVRDRLRRQEDACADSLEYMEMIEDETRRCSAIVRSLGDLARDGPAAMAPADLAKLARSVVALLEMDRKAKPVTFDVEGEDALEAICDPDKVKQLLLNLLINARDASEPGATVTVRLDRVGDAAARIEVADTGRGIERKDLQRVFEPFHTDKMQGLGIGLFLCERIAALHGGSIRAESEGRGRGARFVVEFPTHTSAIVPADARTSSTPPMSEPPFLPFCRPTIEDDEIASVVESMRSGWITTGPKVQAFEKAFRDRLGVPHAVALNSGTAGMHVLLAAMGIGPGDEVISASLTWPSTPNMVEFLGAKPVFADVLPGTLLLDPADVARRVTPRTKAIVPVHYAGAPFDVDAIAEAAGGIPVIDDAAHAAGTAYKGVEVGAGRNAAVFSFHPIKNVTTGEGGVVTTHDDALADRMRRLRFHGVNKDSQSRYAKTASPRYEVIEPGWKYNMLDLEAAIGVEQMKKLDRFNGARSELAARYREAFASVPEIRPPAVPAYDHLHAWHLYVVQVDIDALSIDRDGFMAEMGRRGIGVGLHFTAVHLHRFYREKYGLREGDLPVTEAACERIVSLPLYPLLTHAQQDRVVEAVKDVVREHRRVRG